MLLYVNHHHRWHNIANCKKAYKDWTTVEDLLALGRQSMQISEFETSEGDIVRPYLIKKNA